MRVTTWRFNAAPSWLVISRPAVGGGSLPAVVGQEFHQVGVQGDVAVVVELAHRDTQPMGVADLDHGVALQVA
jgi:hypothetical protein